MKVPLKRWGYPENPLAEKQWDLLRLRLFEQWKLSKTSVSPVFVQVPEISNKQKDFIRDIFANITTKRILFQNDKRHFYSVGKNGIGWSEMAGEIKIADAVILPINAREIQDVLQQAQLHDISIQVATEKNIFPHVSFPKNKLYCIISLELMQKVIRFEPEKYTITVQSGMTLLQLQTFLAEQGRELPVKNLGQEQKSVFELLQNDSQLRSVVSGITTHTPGGVIPTVKNDALFSYFLHTTSKSILSEITFKINPLPKYIRRIDAQLTDLETAAQIIAQLHNQGISFNEIRIGDLEPNLLLPDHPVEKSKEHNDFLNSFLKKSEEILFKDETVRDIAVSLCFNEYQSSRSSALLKTKEIIHQNNGKATSVHLLHPAEEWIQLFPYFEIFSEENPIDTFHFSSKIHFERMDKFSREIRKKLDKSIYYPTSKLEYLIQFSKFDFPEIQIDLYILASQKHRKQDDAHLKLMHFFKEYLQPVNTSSTDTLLNEELIQLLKSKIDSKGIMSTKYDPKTGNNNSK